MTLRRQRTMTTMLLTTVLSAVWIAVEGNNLLRDHSFENPQERAWEGKGFKMELYQQDKTHGQVSLLCKNRKKELAGPSQTLPASLLSPGRGYELQADIRLLNGNPDKLFQSFKATMVFHFKQTTKPEGGAGKEEVGKADASESWKAPSCKRLKGEELEKCLEARRLWNEQAKKKKAEEKGKKSEAGKGAREEGKTKKAERKQRKQQEREQKGKGKEAKGEKRKQRGKDKNERRTERERKKQERERRKQERERERQRKEREREKQSGKADGNNARATPEAIPSGHVNGDAIVAADGRLRVRREISQTRQRRQQKRQRTPTPPTTILKAGQVIAPTDDNVISPSSGVVLPEGAYIIAWRAWVTPQQGWIKLIGSINAPVIDFTKVVLRIQGPDPQCDFLMDNVTLYEIPERTDWLAESHVMIDRYRKSNLSLRVRIPSNIPRGDIDIQVKLKKHLFAFGSKVEDNLLMSARYEAFQEMVYTLFNWATIGSFKWKFDKGLSLYDPDFSEALTALRILRENGLKVRGHSILWGVEKNIPDAVLATPPDQLPALVTFRTQYIVNSTRGRVEHWDVQNELLHGHWYEETTKDPNITMKVFQEARRMDPYPKLYLNDFTAVTSGANTEDYHDTALRFIEAGTGIQGLGIQGHTKDYVKPDPTLMWRHLDRLAETGLELFMTEFDLGWDDDAVRADWLEDAMRTFFAHPGLSGVILWGFWKDMQTYKNKYLVYGQDLKFAEPGERFVCLIKKEWTTNETFNMASYAGGALSLRAFQGDYEVVVRRRGVPVMLQQFTLGKQDTAVDIDVTQSYEPIQVKEEKDYVPQCISHRDRKSLGVLYTTSSEPSLTCHDLTADQSAASSSPHVTVTCPEGTVMTDCSSFNQYRPSRYWRGEEIGVEKGTATCTALAAPAGYGNVRVSARCCQLEDLTCDYRQAGPSSPIPNAMAEARCPLGHVATGCSVSSDFSHIRGMFPASNLTGCRAVNGLHSLQEPQYQSGVLSGAVCCKSRTLQCRAVSSAPIGGRTDAKVMCLQDEVMTGCQLQTYRAAASGSTLSTDSSGIATCTAHAATDHPDQNDDGTITAVAICCRS